MEYERIEKAITYIKSDPKLFARAATVRPSGIKDGVGTMSLAAYQFALRLNCRFRNGFTPDELRVIMRGLK